MVEKIKELLQSGIYSTVSEESDGQTKAKPDLYWKNPYFIAYTIDDVMPLLYWIIIRFPTFSFFSLHFHSICATSSFSSLVKAFGVHRSLDTFMSFSTMFRFVSTVLYKNHTTNPIWFDWTARSPFSRYRLQIYWHFSKLTQTGGASKSL